MLVVEGASVVVVVLGVVEGGVDGVVELTVLVDGVWVVDVEGGLVTVVLVGLLVVVVVEVVD